MLVDNKFFYLSIPRCGSTSFLISCFRNGINVNHYDREYDLDYQQNVYGRLLNNITDDEELKYILRHCHEPISTLEYKFGKNYEIIAVKRNRYERFISYWRHCINAAIYYNDIETAIKFSKMDENEILDFDPEILYTSNLKSTSDFCNIFIDKFGLKNHIKKNPVKTLYLTGGFFPAFVPVSYYHQHDNRVLWFDFNDELNLMEEWVSDKLSRNFKLKKVNSSQKINHNLECNLKLTDKFIEKYDSIYNRFEIIKTKKSIL